MSRMFIDQVSQFIFQSISFDNILFFNCTIGCHYCCTLLLSLLLLLPACHYRCHYRCHYCCSYCCHYGFHCATIVATIATIVATSVAATAGSSTTLIDSVQQDKVHHFKFKFPPLVITVFAICACLLWLPLLLVFYAELKLLMHILYGHSIYIIIYPH